MEHKRSAAAPVAIAALLLLPVLYVGSYLALAVPSPPDGEPFGNRPYYRFSRSYGETIFWPLERLDPRMRREPIEVPLGPADDPFGVPPARGGAPSVDPFAE